MSERDKASGGGIDLRTLTLAAFSSAAAAVIVSQVWEGGTVISAAVTPVLVTLLKEGLDRPTAKLTEATLRKRETVRVAEGAEPPPAADDPEPAPAELEPDIRVYGREEPRRWGKLHPKVALVTGLVAFLIAAVVLTVPELISGTSLTGSGGTTLFRGDRENRKSAEDKDSTDTSTQETVTDQQETVTEQQTQTQTVPETTSTAPATPAPQTAPTPQAAPPPTTGGEPAPVTP